MKSIPLDIMKWLRYSPGVIWSCCKDVKWAAMLSEAVHTEDRSMSRYSFLSFLEWFPSLLIIIIWTVDSFWIRPAASLVRVQICDGGDLCEWTLTWRADRVSGEGHVEGGLLAERRRIHPPANEEARSAAEEHAHHQQQPARHTQHRCHSDSVLF